MVEALTSSGNKPIPPRPKVNARGGLPMKRSPDSGLRHVRLYPLHMVSMSWWVCTAALGCPVVPEVNAIRQGSFLEVGRFSNSTDFLFFFSSRSPSRKLINCSRQLSLLACSNSSSSLVSHSAMETRALLMMVFNSIERKRGIVETAIPPALMTPNHAANIG